MKFDRTGIVLYTIKYAACVSFYKEILGLTILFETEMLTCFEFGASYLMVELDDEYKRVQDKSERIRTCLRMNVPNVKILKQRLDVNNVEFHYREHSWGTILKFIDPDGNLCAFKDSEKFEEQIAKYKEVKK